jgi:hypothetical protein
MEVSDHRTVIAPQSGHEKIRSHQNGGGDSNHGQGSGKDKAKGQGTGSGKSTGQGSGKDKGQGNGSGNSLVLSILSQLPGPGLWCDGRTDDQEGKQAQHRERGELQRAVHEVDGVEPGPEGLRRAGPQPTGGVGTHAEQPPLLIQQPLLPLVPRLALRSAGPRGISRKRDAA